MAKRSKSSTAWLARQRKDRFVQAANQAGTVSRAHYKLQQLNDRFELLRPGMTVLELGAAPGGWTRYLADQITSGRVVACDFRPISAPANVDVIEGEVGSDAVDSALEARLGAGGCDLVVSDMAPNITGVRAADQAASMGLADLAVYYAERYLNRGGHLLVKLFQGEGFDAFVAEQRKYRRTNVFAWRNRRHRGLNRVKFSGSVWAFAVEGDGIVVGPVCFRRCIHLEARVNP